MVESINKIIDNIKDSYVKSNGGDITNTTITYTLFNIFGSETNT